MDVIRSLELVGDFMELNSNYVVCTECEHSNLIPGGPTPSVVQCEECAEMIRLIAPEHVEAVESGMPE